MTISAVLITVTMQLKIAGLKTCCSRNFCESVGYIIKPLIFSVFLHVTFILLLNLDLS